MTAHDSILKLVVIDHEEDFLALEGCWDGLLELSAIRTPFLTWDWMSLWWQCYREAFALRVAVLRDAHGRTVAIAPMVLGRGVDGGRRHLRQLCFIGGLGDVASEGLDFIIPRGDEERMAPLLAQVIAQTRGEWDIVELSSLHDNSPNLAAMRDAMGSVGNVEHRFAPIPSFIYELPKTWDEVLAAMSSRTRRLQRGYWRTMVENHAAKFSVGGNDLATDVAFASLQRLHAMRYGIGESTFLRPNAVSFHRQLIERWAPSGRAVLPCIELDGHIAAARYGFTHFGCYWDFQTGFDTAFSDISLGNMGMAWAMQCAMQRGLALFDHLPGDQEHKRQRSTTSRSILHLETFNSRSPRALAFTLLRKTKRWAHEKRATRASPF